MVQGQSSPAPYARQRRHQRFDLQFPVCLSFPSAGVVRKLETVSSNVSIGGLLLKARAPIPPRTLVKLTMDVRGPQGRRAVRLQGEGEVVRLEPLEPGDGFAIAIECKKPISEIRGLLPVAG